MSGPLFAILLILVHTLKGGKAKVRINDRIHDLGLRPGCACADARRGYGVVLNPRMGDPITLSEKDKVIVLAEA